MHEKPLEFGRMHTKKYIFCDFEISEFLKKNWTFLKFPIKLSIFNIGFISYSVSLQLNIKLNY
jgi:hypothetical protein